MSSSFITCLASSRSFFTKESMLSVSMRMAASAILRICTCWVILLPSRNLAISAISDAWSPILSISEIIFSAAEIVLRSRATGCC